MCEEKNVTNDPAPPSAEVLKASDQELLRRFVCEEDRLALEEFVARHGTGLWRFCLKTFGTFGRAHDEFQDAIIRLIKRARTLTNPVGWLRRMLERRALAKRSRKTTVNYVEASVLEDSVGQPSIALESAIENEHLLMLKTAINELPDKYRLPIELCDLQGQTMDDAARHLRWQPGTLRARLRKARNLLRSALEEKGLVLALPIAIWLADEVEGDLASAPRCTALEPVTILPIERAFASTVSANQDFRHWLAAR